MTTTARSRTGGRAAVAAALALAAALMMDVVFAAQPAAAPTAEAKVDAWGSNLVGVWKMSYDPSLQDVQEVDAAYLIVLPGLTYIRIYDVGVRRFRVIESGSVKVEGNQVKFVPGGFSDANGGPARPPYPTTETLYYSAEEKVVFFDDRWNLVARPTLRHAGTLNYGYARAF